MKTNRTSSGAILLTSTFIWLLAAAVMTGCGADKGSGLQTISPVNTYPMDGETAPPETDTDTSQEASDAGQQASDTEQTPDTGIPSGYEDIPPQSETELMGSVKTIGTDSLVISQAFDMGTVEQDGVSGDVIVAPAEGSADEVLITVHVTVQTVYEIHTVRNGGINGDSDVDISAASFSDIRTDLSLTMEGHYENGDFHADRVTIYHFI